MWQTKPWNQLTYSLLVFNNRSFRYTTHIVCEEEGNCCDARCPKADNDTYSSSTQAQLPWEKTQMRKKVYLAKLNRWYIHSPQKLGIFLRKGKSFLNQSHTPKYLVILNWSTISTTFIEQFALFTWQLTYHKENVLDEISNCSLSCEELPKNVPSRRRKKPRKIKL